MKSVNGQQLIEALISGANSMVNNKERIDSMNVFPVPDGDTGSNMAATAEYAANELKKMDQNSTASEVAAKFARGMLLGARGNSGVITSQIFKGFSVAVEDKKELSSFDIVEGFAQAKDYAYKSVMKPVEGTILTVIRLVHEDLSQKVTPSDEIQIVFNKAKEAARKACDITPTMLPVLKEVGVTDSGGEGLFVILEGIASYFEGKPVELSKQAPASAKEFIVNGEEDFNGEYGYCTEFIVTLKAPDSFKKDRFAAGLEKMGSSTIIVTDENILKVHTHTLRPGNLLTYAQKFGEFMKIKSENMTLQANESKSSRKASQKPNEKNDEVSKAELNIGVISCNVGAGIVSEMKELGADFVIESGQSSNPSAKDFLKAIDTLNTNKIILLPNNSNIVLAAQQVASISDKEIIVIPSKTQMEGISAIMNFDREMTLHENQESMNEGIAGVKTGQVTQAARTTKIDGVSVKEGEFLAIADRKIISSTKSKTKSASAICDNLINDDTELVTIYFGGNSSRADAEEVASYIESNFSAETEVKEGKQPLYNFLMAFE